MLTSAPTRVDVVSISVPGGGAGARGASRIHPAEADGAGALLCTTKLTKEEPTRSLTRIRSQHAFHGVGAVEDSFRVLSRPRPVRVAAAGQAEDSRTDHGETPCCDTTSSRCRFLRQCRCWAALSLDGIGRLVCSQFRSRSNQSVPTGRRSRALSFFNESRPPRSVTALPRRGQRWPCQSAGRRAQRFAVGGVESRPGTGRCGSMIGRERPCAQRDSPRSDRTSHLRPCRAVARDQMRGCAGTVAMVSTAAASHTQAAAGPSACSPPRNARTCAGFPATAPNTATPKAPAAWRAVLFTPPARPARSRERRSWLR